MKKEMVLALALGASLVTLGTAAAAPLPCDPCGPVKPCDSVQPCDEAGFDPCQPIKSKSDAFRLTPRGLQQCDPCDAAACDPCEPAGCGVDDEPTCDSDLSCGDVTCRPKDDLGACDKADGFLSLKKKKHSSRLSVYGSAGAIVGNFDGGYFSRNDGRKLGFQLGGGVKATVGIERGRHAIEASYKGLFASKSTSWFGFDTPSTPTSQFERVNVENDFQAGDVSFVINLERLPSIKILAGVGCSNFNIKATWYDTGGGTIRGIDTIKNDLIGVHLGGQWSRNIGRRLGIAVDSKIGVYANTVGLDLDGTPFPYGNCRGAWGASCGLNVSYKVSRCMSSFIGYDMTMIEGVERGGFAVDNIVGPNIVPNARGLATDRMLAQGVTFGVKLNY